jgi:RNA polymerase sigma factor FliA
MTAKAQIRVQLEEQVPESGCREIGSYEIQEALDFEEPMPEPAAAPANDVVEVYDPAKLLDKYQALVRQIAGGFQRKLPRNVLRDDLIAAGMSGLWDAVRKHGHEATGNFDWYVRVRIRGAILDELRAQDWLPRRARAAAAEAAAAEGSKLSAAPVVLRFDEVSETEQARCLTAGEASNTEQTVEANFAKKRLEEAMAQLPERERRIVAMHYFRGIKFKELGEMLGVSEPRISQLHSRAMTRLKSILADAA